MSPIHPLLEEDDTLNKAVYVMFKENIRQPLVIRDGRIVGVINIMDIFPVILEIAGDQCFIK
jgi:predicted transcriptional regulator